MKIFRYDRVDSTNEQARRLVRGGEGGETACVLAREQTAGRGTRGRRWCSPRDAGIYLSLLRRPGAAAAPSSALYTLAAGVACAEALKAQAGVAVSLKAVNDLWAGGRKLGGILTETIVENGLVTSVIIGVGVNVRRAAREIGGPCLPVSLEELVPPPRFRRLSIDAVAEGLIDHLVRWTRRAERDAPEAIRRAWAARRMVPPRGR